MKSTRTFWKAIGISAVIALIGIGMMGCDMLVGGGDDGGDDWLFGWWAEAYGKYSETEVILISINRTVENLSMGDILIEPGSGSITTGGELYFSYGWWIINVTEIHSGGIVYITIRRRGIDPTRQPVPILTAGGPVYHIVQFREPGRGNRHLVPPRAVRDGQLLTLPPPPRLDDGYQIFQGWYFDTGFNYVFDSSAPITEDILLHARGVWGQIGAGGFVSYRHGSSVTITGFTGAETDMVIPSVHNGLPVVGIGNRAFQNRGLTSVSIPNSVTGIGNSAFANNQLTGTLSIPDNVTNIGNSAFANNQLSGTLTIPDSVTSIGNGAFGNNELTSVTIGNSVTSIGNNVFANNPITSLTIGAPNIGSWFLGLNLANLIILDSVTSIGNSAFSNNQLTRVVIPDSVTSIGSSAFANNQLTGTLTIPDSVTSIGNSAFANNQLASVVIPTRITSIGNSVFANNRLTDTLTIPDNVTSIGNSAFANNQLTGTLTIPNSVTSIGEWAFAYNQLTGVNIPNSVTSIGHWAFSNNPQLANITIPFSSLTIADQTWDGHWWRGGIPANVTWHFNP